jgi:hypothetical protein
MKAMRVRVLAFALVVTSALTAAGSASGQSLADVARKESERRKQVQEPVKTFDNTDLKAAPPASFTAAPAEPAPASASSGKDASKPAADGKDAKPAAKSDAPKDQKYWGDRARALREKLATDQVLAEAMQTRINALTADFVNRDDPAQRAVIATNKQRALDELASLKKSIDDDTKAVSDLEEEARKAGVPPGWLR